MTVDELISALSAYDPELEVLTEGCDCVGDIKEVISVINIPTHVSRDDMERGAGLKKEFYNYVYLKRTP